jgi:ferredoxin
MRLVIDPSACDGFGFCAEILPEALTSDEWGYPVVSEDPISPELLAAASQAVRSCPRRALRLEPPT